MSDTLLAVGAGLFGVVMGWMTHRILVRKEKGDWSDLATVISTVGGGAILALFPAQTATFAAYAIGLFVGFFVYFAVFLLMAKAAGLTWLEILTGKPGKLDRFIMGEDESPLTMGQGGNQNPLADA